jgi:hypothetical protein
MNLNAPSFRLFAFLAVLAGLLPFSPSATHAMSSGSTGNDPVQNHGWPTGSEGVANLKTRVAFWSGPLLVGDTFDFRAKSSADLNEALKAFAKIAVPKRELILRNGPAESHWLKSFPVRKNDPLGARIDWTFVIWHPGTWYQRNNDPRSTFAAEYSGFRRPVDPPRIVAWFGGGGKLVWEEIVVPEGIIVIDQRGKPGDGPSFTGGVYDMNTGKAIEGATVTVSRGKDVAEDVELPVTKTDAAGRFVMKGFPEGACVAVVSHPGYATRTSSGYEPFRGSDTREVTLHLAKAAALSGVVRGSDGAPIAGVRVKARPVIARDGFGYPGSGGRRVETDAEGRFVIEGLPIGFAGLSAQKVRLSNTADITALYDVPNKEPVEFTMSGTGTVKGTLKAAEGKQVMVSIDQAVGAGKVGSWGGSMNCQPDGSFEFKNVPPGDYLVGPSRGHDLKAGDAGVKKITVKVGGTVTVEIVER